MEITKYLHIKFCNAKLFPKNKFNKDYVNIFNVPIKRSTLTNNNFVEPITISQISNIIHVLWGKRPVPAFRYVPYDIVPELYNMARLSYLKISTPKQPIVRNGATVQEFIPELIQTNKSQWNSWKKVTNIQWFMVEGYFQDKNDFNMFISLLEKTIGFNPTVKPVAMLANLSIDYNIKEIIDWLIIKKRTPLIHFLDGNKDSTLLSGILTMRFPYTVIRGVEKIYNLSGDIFIPVNDELLSKIYKNSTTLLDGGFTYIVDVIDIDDMDSLYDYEKVGEISNEKY